MRTRVQRGVVRFGRFGLISAALVIAGSCAHVDTDTSGREPASAYSRACKKLSPDDLRAFRVMVRSDTGIGRSMADLGELAHVLHVDEALYDRKRVSMAAFLDPERGILFNLIEGFAKVLLGECHIIREGEDPSIFVRKSKTPEKYRLAARLCGPADSALANKDRIHSQDIRDWADPSRDENPEIRAWVARVNQLADPRTGELLAPDKITELCTGFKSRKNVEDTIENLFLCMDAFVFNLADYDHASGKYALDDHGMPRFKAPSVSLDKCVKGYVEGKVEVGEDGTPVGLRKAVVAAPAGKASRSADSGSEPPQTSDSVSASTSIHKTSAAAPAAPAPAGTVGAVTGSGATRPVVLQSDAVNLPGDAADSGSTREPRRQDDACVRAFVQNARASRTPLPADLSAEKLLEQYRSERDRFARAIGRHQTEALSHGYIVAALERHWDSPKAYNDNLRELVNSCSNYTVRTELAKSVESSMLDERVLDGSYDEKFVNQSDLADDKGRRMLETTRRILELRRYVELLNFDMGASQVKTFKTPHWIGYVPVGQALTGPYARVPYLSDFELPIPFLHYFAGQDFLIDFGKHADFQCNMFSTMSANDFVPRTSELITEADRAIRRKLADEGSRTRAFCTRDGRCSYPPLFEYYLHETDPERFRKGDELAARMRRESRSLEEYYEKMGMLSMHLRDWCSMRFNAAQSLVAMELELVTLYPALAHAEQLDDDKPGPPLFDRLTKTKRATDAQKIKLAAAEADRVLPKMQQDLKKYVGRVCGDLNSAQMESTYMAVLNRQFMRGFDYCGGLSPEYQVRLGLSCADRQQFLGCKLSQEADEWRAKKEIPKFLYEVGMAGLDALFVYSAASGGLSAALTPRSVLTGGLTGLGFTAANYGISTLIARNNEAEWNDYSRGVAGAALEGVDSYANAITAIAASQPKARVQDFVAGFVLGAMLSGKQRGEGKPLPRGGGKGTPPEVFDQVARKVGELAESKPGGGVQFSAKSLSELKDWLLRKAAESPEFPDELTRNLGETLNTLSDADYARLFDGPEGRLSASRVRAAMGVRLKRAATRFGGALGEVRAKLSFKKLMGEKLGAVEQAVEATRMQSADLANLARDLGPREAAAVAEAAEEAAAKIAGESQAGRTERLSQFLRKLCGLAIWCPNLQTLKGCPL